MVIFIAGAVHAPPKEKATAAAGFYAESREGERAGRRIPDAHEQSQYVAEFFAALAAIRSVSKETTLTLFSAQPYIREAMNKKLQRWEHEGWVGVKHRDILRCVAVELKARKAPTFFKEAKPGTPERAECMKAARLAKRAARAPTIEAWDMTLPPGTALPGLSLIDNRQKLFYRSIREEKTKKLAPRASTDKKLKVI
jgi:hypothetical protein